MYPFAPVGKYQSDIGASSARGQPFLNRSTRSGLLMNGRPKAIMSASPSAIALSSRLLRVAAVAHERAVEYLAELGQRHWLAEFVEAERQSVHDVQVCQPEAVKLAGDERELLSVVR